MEAEATSTLTLDVAGVIARLDGLAKRVPSGVVAFDGDGTLWLGDVGEDVFKHAVRGSLLRDAAQPALAREATAYGFSAEGSASQLGERLLVGYLAGTYPEREVCAMMAWCYAGFELDELDVLIREALDQAAFDQRLHQELFPILSFAKRVGLRVMVVSASPQPIVEVAASRLGISADNVVACRAAVHKQCILPSLAAPVPYAEGKPAALAAYAEGHELLASFGDNVFDIELLRAARLGVAVRPKPALRARLPELPGIVLLEE